MTLLATDLNETMATQAQSAWQNILERAEPELASQLLAQLAQPTIQLQLSRVLACSPFVAQAARSRPAMLLHLLQSGSLQRSLLATGEGEILEGLQLLLAEPDVELEQVLRRYRQSHMVRIVWRDFCRLADTTETIVDTSLLAEACIGEALEFSRRQLETRFGQPRGGSSGSAQQLIVLAMGKLGARELNVSSDIDLIFAFPEAGSTDSPDASISNQEFFTKLGQVLVNALDKVTVDGFVFRVDMRLRPYGDSGALVSSFAALEQYYQDQGRDWERYALIKARPISGDPDSGADLMATLRPFIYRRYVDFGVIESLRSMKAMINAEVRRRNLRDDVKLGHGGIREVEFIAQCFQLIRGGRDLGLQRRELLLVLRECAQLGCLPAVAVDELSAAYLFLRDSEHAIQGYLDKQTQALPTDEFARLAMATVMGFNNWQAYLAQLESHRATVAQHFQNLIAAPDESGTAGGGGGEHQLHWSDTFSVHSLEELGFRAPGEAQEFLAGLAQSPRVVTLQAEGKSRLEQFMPQLLQTCADTEDPDLALQRVIPLVVAVLRRSAYLALLLENPPALHELVVLCGASPWIARQMSQNPVLLDELLNRESLYTPPDKAMLRDELRQQVARLAVDDLEAQMDALRYFKASHVLRVAASELTGRLPLMQVSDNLTAIAEVILEQVIAVAWADLAAKYGEPSRPGSGSGFSIFGYGKLGGIELGYGSDLDLVFVYDANKQGVTDGNRSIDNTVFYTRLGQRIIHILDTRMAMGQLYEVDMRLRPSGESGMLVITSTGFRSYQEQNAWTWEHQALVRARFVAGDDRVAQQVEAIRIETLCKPRDSQVLMEDVRKMRVKMRNHLLPEGNADSGDFDLKQGRGGIVDIEFMVQYAVLAWSNKVPALAQWSDNVRILEALDRESLFEPGECEALTKAYIAYRSAAHQFALQQQSVVAPAGNFSTARKAVMDKWQQLFGPDPLA
ncbi:MAG: bifunctional [glutamate--ammonia ligase]-adenylyl-L-tyrosine phosphorylase/[glutamate--ammonia-ligase] adenylyltransferase [Proteobacteria bacterium]|nr:bifunctional [glutamate--ammonia ligase]-adenylyl-L-tyrosine phosphorylase/[glutamate--ammonia-ligase] adenylyltransferase [Pseudomonadota bacterium]